MSSNLCLKIIGCRYLVAHLLSSDVCSMLTELFMFCRGIAGMLAVMVDKLPGPPNFTCNAFKTRTYK